MGETPRSVLVVGSGLAGLTCAAELAAAGCDTVVVSPGRSGRDGATHRVHGLAPWVLLTAPWSRGDSPARFLADLTRRGLGLDRPGLAEVLAESAHEAALELVADLDLEPMDAGPVLLAGDEAPRGLRCLPRQRRVMLAPLLARCSSVGVRVQERTLVFGLLVRDGRGCGVVALDRADGTTSSIRADAVVLACGGSGAVFPISTSPRWCRGSGLALAGAAGVLLHRPELAQALPVTATPPLFFPSSGALLRSRIEVGGRALPEARDVEGTTLAIAEAVRAGVPVLLEPTAEAAAILPARVRASAGFREHGTVPLTIAQHHGIGGVAIDSWGRTSLPGLYACGEAAGGVQGRRRTMGTGLLEAAIFARRAAHAIVRDLARDGRAGDGAATPAVPNVPLDPVGLERRLDDVLGPLVMVRPPEALAAAMRALESWPVRAHGSQRVEEGGALAAIRLSAALAMFAAIREDPGAAQAAAPERGSGEGRWRT